VETDPNLRAKSAEAKEKALADLRADVSTAREELVERKRVARPGMEDIVGRKAASAAAMATLLGAAVAAAGVRVLDPFMTPDGAGITGSAPGFQLDFLRFVDVVLTALLLAGGADGIHQILKDFLKKRNDLT
jgi:hypothetical protein